MFVDRMYQESVGYLVTEHWDREEKRYFRVPVGTVFFIQMQLEGVGDYVSYAVTCRHLIEGVESDTSCRETFIRINNDATHKAEDFPVLPTQWIFSQKTDVAVAHVEFPPGFLFWTYPISQHWKQPLFAGQSLFFIGMFQPLPGLDRVQAIVRCGTVASVLVTLPIRISPNLDVTEITAHLTESRSWGGESGSPVYAYEEHVRIDPNQLFQRGFPYHMRPSVQKSGVLASQVQPWLLGILHGHFEINKGVTEKHGRQIGGVDVNSGIGVVIPVEEIIATLQDPKLVQEREGLAAVRKAAPAKPD